MKQYIPVSIRRKVIRRAKSCCEYCLLPQQISPTTFHVDHVISEKQGGSSELTNLALSCSICNINKGSDIVAYFQEDASFEPLFNPRKDKWKEHFSLQKAGQLVPLTKMAKGTIRILRMNETDRIEERRMNIQMGVYDFI